MTTRLDNICDLIAGFAFKSKDFGKYDNKVIKITNIIPPYVDIGNAMGVNLSKYNENKLKKFIASEGDYVLAMTGATIGKIGRIVHGSAYINQRVLLFKPKKGINKDFLYAVLTQQDFEKYIYNHIDSDSAQPNISARTIGKYEFWIPSEEDQNRIGHFVSVIDNKISTNIQINDNLEKQAQLIFDSMFQNLCGSKRVGDYVCPRRGSALLSKDAIFGDIPVVAGGLEPATYHNVANTLGPVVTISSSGANAGFVRLWGVSVWSSDSSYIDSSMTNNVYFWYAFLKHHQNNIYNIQTGSAQPHIYPSHIMDLPVGELDHKMVSLYTKTVTPLFSMITINQKENKKLISLRDFLLPILMNGQATIES